MFSNSNDRYDFLDAAKPVEEQIWRAHIDGFIQNFIVQIKRDRWRYLCLDKPEKGRLEASRMYSDLIKERRQPLDYDIEKSLSKNKTKGIYYSFSGEAWWLSAAEAFHVGHGYESIFFIPESEKCVYFWHEMEEFLLQKPGDKDFNL